MTRMKMALATMVKMAAQVLVMTLALAGSLAAAPRGADKPKVTMKQARETALAAVPGGKIQSAELETEEGRRVYSFDIKIKGGIKEVWVDAQTGAVIKNEAESKEEEQAEKAKERSEKRK